MLNLIMFVIILILVIRDILREKDKKKDLENKPEKFDETEDSDSETEDSEQERNDIKNKVERAIILWAKVCAVIRTIDEIGVALYQFVNGLTTFLQIYHGAAHGSATRTGDYYQYGRNRYPRYNYRFKNQPY